MSVELEEYYNNGHRFYLKPYVARLYMQSNGKSGLPAL